MKPIYLDYNATTPIDPQVADAMIPYLREHFGNPSSSHAYGIASRTAVDRARRQVADMLGCEIDEVIFTSGGSESNNYAIKGIAHACRDRGNHIITSAIEHPAVIEVCRYLEQHGYRITYVDVDQFGRVDPDDIRAAVTAETILVTIMHANNEVGTIEPIAEIAAIAREHGITMHTDAAQSVGKIPVRVDELKVDLLSIAGHKLYAPKGIGALYVRSGIRLEKQVHGADHERNWRAGTENVLEIVGLGEACRLVADNLRAYQSHMKARRDRLEQELVKRSPDLRVNGHPEHRLPNTASVSFRGLEANTILSQLDSVAASAGAACHSDQVDLSPVLEAMKVPLGFAMGTIRFSVGRLTSDDDIDRAVDAVARVVASLSTGEENNAQSGSEVKLTQFTHGLGCACKLRPQLLEEVLRSLPKPSDDRILVGSDTSDDAAVYRISDDIAIVQTVDFFSPIVDDPYQFGAIAAANSLSDIYAMGAMPLFALSVVGFPSNRLPADVLHRILRGAHDKAAEAGIAVIGGHTVDDTEPKYGLAVTGTVHPHRVLTNRGARPGDALVLTKPIGTGILSTALKQGLLDTETTERLISVMAALNAPAAEAMRTVDVHACTDITGFGLLGHLLEMLRASRSSADIIFGRVPILAKAFDHATSGLIPGGTRDNAAFTSSSVDYDDDLSEVRRLLLNDAQTSGGLLIALSSDDADRLIADLHDRGITEAAVIGVVEGGEPTQVHVRRND